MDTHTPESPIDPLRRVFVPIERGLTGGALLLQTTDKQTYIRNGPGLPMRRIPPKVNGKIAKKARRRAHA